jgi:hypothetical protein
MSRTSNSVGNIQGFFPWLSENTSFFIMRLRGLKNSEAGMDAILNEIDEYAQRYQAATGRSLADARILEIGYGARPNRLLAMISLGYNANGIDLDKPILRFGIGDFISSFRSNGIKRALKSFIRSLVFDRNERRALDRSLRKRGSKLICDETRFLVGDASTFAFQADSLDFIYSEDVFEHIPPTAVNELSRNLSHALSLDGLALISPSIYTGIGGGHLVEWYPHTLNGKKQRQTEPWEHLRKRRLVADCYLNELRVHEFENIFKVYFDLVNVVSRDAGLGASYLTSEIRSELSEFSEAELLSDKWLFALRKKAAVEA